MYHKQLAHDNESMNEFRKAFADNPACMEIIEKRVKEFPVKEKERITSEFRSNKGLLLDYANVLYMRFLSFDKDDFDFNRIEPIENYEEYLKRRHDLFYDYILSLTDPTALIKLDQIVAKFNADIPRIKQEHDKTAIRVFEETVTKMLR